MLESPLEGMSAPRDGTFTEDQEAADFMAAMASIGQEG